MYEDSQKKNLPKMLAHFSELAYRPGHYDIGYLGWTREDITIASMSMSIFYNKTRDMRVVAVAGTNDFHDWAVNIDRHKNDAGFHSGFWDAAYDLLSYVMAKTRAKTNYWTGHSMGGAVVAILAYLDTWTHNGFDAVFVFGAPRICDSSTHFEVGTRIRLYAYAVEGDPVPSLPAIGYDDYPTTTVLDPPMSKCCLYLRCKRVRDTHGIVNAYIPALSE